MRTVVTDRLILMPATDSILQAELEDRDRLGFLLGAQIPYNWPPDEFLEAVPMFLENIRRANQPSGWQPWYWLRKESAPEKPTLIGNGGFLSAPDRSGTVEMGYSVLPQYGSSGYATEGAKGLIDWAFAQPGVIRIVAEALVDNEGSKRVLDKLGFVPAADPAREGMQRFELVKI